MSQEKPKAVQFVLGQKAPDFWWTVTVPVPTDNDYTHATLDVLFRPLSQERVDKMRGLGLKEDETPPTDEQICSAVVRGWRGLIDPQGAEVAFSPEALQNLLAAPMVRTAIVATYLACMSGVAARKNA
jgi:hypothetical protein